MAQEFTIYFKSFSGTSYQVRFEPGNSDGPRAEKSAFAEYDAFTVGEAALTSPEQAVAYVSQDRQDKEMQSMSTSLRRPLRLPLT